MGDGRGAAAPGQHHSKTSLTKRGETREFDGVCSVISNRVPWVKQRDKRIYLLTNA